MVAAPVVTAMMAAMTAVMWPFLELIFQLAARYCASNHAEETMVAILIPRHPTG